MPFDHEGMTINISASNPNLFEVLMPDGKIKQLRMGKLSDLINMDVRQLREKLVPTKVRECPDDVPFSKIYTMPSAASSDFETTSDCKHLANSCMRHPIWPHPVDGYDRRDWRLFYLADENYLYARAIVAEGHRGPIYCSSARSFHIMNNALPPRAQHVETYSYDGSHHPWDGLRTHVQRGPDRLARLPFMDWGMGYGRDAGDTRATDRPYRVVDQRGRATWLDEPFPRSWVPDHTGCYGPADQMIEVDGYRVHPWNQNLKLNRDNCLTFNPDGGVY